MNLILEQMRNKARHGLLTEASNLSEIELIEAQMVIDSSLLAVDTYMTESFILEVQESFKDRWKRRAMSASGYIKRGSKATGAHIMRNKGKYAALAATAAGAYAVHKNVGGSKDALKSGASTAKKFISKNGGHYVKDKIVTTYNAAKDVVTGGNESREAGTAELVRQAEVQANQYKRPTFGGPTGTSQIIDGRQKTYNPVKGYKPTKDRTKRPTFGGPTGAKKAVVAKTPTKYTPTEDRTKRATF